MRKPERIQRVAEEPRCLLHWQVRVHAERERAAQKRAERSGNWLGGVAFLLGFPSLVIGFPELMGESASWMAGASVAASILFGALSMRVVHVRLRQRKRSAVAAEEHRDR